MLRRTPRPTRTDTLFPYTPRSRSRAARPRGEGRPGRAGCGGAGAARLRLVSFSGPNCAFVSIASPRREPPLFSLQTIFGSGKQFFELLDESADGASAAATAPPAQVKDADRAPDVGPSSRDPGRP